MPQRIQLKRARGWRMPPGCVKVDRTTRFGNPFRPCRDRTAAECVELFRRWLAEEPVYGDGRTAGDTWLSGYADQRAKLLAALPTLSGKDLACWCKDGHSCHASVLLDLANRPEAP